MVLVWNVTPVGFSVEEEDALDPWILKDKPSILNGYPNLSESIGHVVPSKNFENLSHPRAHPCVGIYGNKNKAGAFKEVFGPDLLAQTFYTWGLIIGPSLKGLRKSRPSTSHLNRRKHKQEFH